MAEQHKDNHNNDDNHTHEIAGIQVGEKSVPTSVIAVIIFIVFFALISWIAPQGF